MLLVLFIVLEFIGIVSSMFLGMFLFKYIRDEVLTGMLILIWIIFLTVLFSHIFLKVASVPTLYDPTPVLIALF
jgi:hypothetical protein